MRTLQLVVFLCVLSIPALADRGIVSHKQSGCDFPNTHNAPTAKPWWRDTRLLQVARFSVRTASEKGSTERKVCCDRAWPLGYLQTLVPLVHDGIAMGGVQIEHLLSLLEDSRKRSREEVIRYVEEHRDQILADLEKDGKSVIPTSDGEGLVLRKAA